MERGGRALWNCADSFAASKTTQQQHTHLLGFHGLLRLLRPSTRISRGRTPPHGQMTCIPHFSSPQTGTSQQCRLGRAQWTRQHCCNQHALPLMLAHLDKAQWGASPPRPRFTVATTTPLRRPPHPLQVHRGSPAPLLFMQAGTAERLMSWHKGARARRS